MNLNPMKITTHPVPAMLRDIVECVRSVEYAREESVALHVAPLGVPGIAFQHNNGRPAVEQIITRSGRASCPPPLYLYGPGIEPSVMHFKAGTSTTTQVIFKPHALKTLLGIDASQLADGWADLREFAAEDLTGQLIEARNEHERMTVLTSFLITKVKEEKPRDALVEASLRMIRDNIGALRVRDLLDEFHISERQFERRFLHAVGLSPQEYLRVKRFNEAVRLIKTGRFERLTDVACALNFSDQSHLIRDIKAFSGMTPKGIVRRGDALHDEQAGYSFV